MNIQCPDCGVVVDTEANAPGSQFACDNCGRPLTVPAGAVPAAPPGAAPPAVEEAPPAEDAAQAAITEAPAEQPAEPTAAELEADVPLVFSAPPSASADDEPVGMVQIDEPEPVSPSAMMFDVEDEDPFTLPIDTEDRPRREPGRPVGALDIDEAGAGAAGQARVAGVDIANPHEFAVPRLDAPPITGQAYPDGYSPAIVARTPGDQQQKPRTGPTGEPLPNFGPPPTGRPGDLPVFPPPGGGDGTPTFGPPPGQFDADTAMLPGIVPGAVPTTDQVGGLNFGAFLWGWVWAAFHGLWTWVFISLLCAPFVQIYLLIKGNQLAWANCEGRTYEQFKASQRKWLIAGLIVVGINVICTGVSIATGIGASLYQGKIPFISGPAVPGDDAGDLGMSPDMMERLNNAEGDGAAEPLEVPAPDSE